MLLSFMDRRVLVLMADGRIIIGTCKGFDPNSNLVLSQAHERIFSTTQPVTQLPMGACVLRGDMVSVVGEFEEHTGEQTLCLRPIPAIEY